jgi:hypothetical protein
MGDKQESGAKTAIARCIAGQMHEPSAHPQDLR